MYTLQRKSHLCIPFLGNARPRSQFPIACVCERFIYSQDRSTYFLQQNRQIDGGNIGINRSQTHECGNSDFSQAVPFLGIFVSSFRYWFFAVYIRLVYDFLRCSQDALSLKWSMSGNYWWWLHENVYVLILVLNENYSSSWWTERNRVNDEYSHPNFKICYYQVTYILREKQGCWSGYARIRIIFRSCIRIISVKSWIQIRICIKVTMQSFRGSKWSRGGQWTLRMEAWRFKMEPWKVCRPEVAELHQFDE